MFAKLFASLYQGTLRGRAHEILVFTNLLAHCDREGYVDKHFKAIAEEVGLTTDEVKAAIAVLESPDAESRSPELDGRRLVRTDEHRIWGWKIVNHAKYRAIKDEEDRREQNRAAQAKWRQRNIPSSAVSTRKQRKPESAHTETETETETEKKRGVVAVGDLRARSNPAPASPTPARLSESFGGDDSEPTETRTVRTSTGPKPPKLEGVPGTNKPTIASALAWFAHLSATTDERWAAEEVREAYRIFDAGQDAAGNWKWGRRDVGDWRAAMAQRMSEAREKRGGKRPPATAADAILRAINGVRVSQSEVEND